MNPIVLINTEFNFKKAGLWALVGVIFGFGILMIFQMKADWQKFLLIGLTVPFLALLTRDLKSFFLAVMLLSVPLNADVNFIYRPHRGGAGGIGINLIDLPLLCLYLIWLVESVTASRERHEKSSIAIIPLIGFLMTAAISTLNSVDLQFSYFELVRMVKAFLLYFYISRQIKTTREVQIVVRFLLCGLFLEGSIAFMQGYLKADTGLGLLGESDVAIEQELDSVGAVTRIWGTFGSSNIFAFYLQFLTPAAIALLFAPAARPRKWFLAAAALTGSMTLLFTLSRGGWLGFAVSLALILGVNLAKGAFNVKKAATVLVFLGVLGIVFFTFSDLIVSRFTSDDSDSAYVRIPMAQVAWSIIQAHPAIGIGINNYTEVMRTYDQTPLKISNWFEYPVHNEFLLIAAETGFAGLFFFVLFVAAILWTGIQYLRQSQTGVLTFNEQLVLGILAGFVSFLIHCFGDFPLLSYFSLLWVLTGIVSAAPYLEQSD